MRPAGWLVAVIVLAVLVPGGVIAGQLVSSTGGAQPPSARSGPSDSPATTTTTSSAPAVAAFVADRPATRAGLAPCTPVSVLASLENQDMVRALAAAYTAKPRDVAGHCVSISVQSETSGSAESDVAGAFAHTAMMSRPTVWLPDSSVWLRLAQEQASAGSPMIPASTPSIARAAIVVAMPAALAHAIGWDHTAPTWAQVFTTAANPTVWTARGHQAWGTFKLGKTSPMTATSGLMALTASYLVNSGDPDGPTLAEVESPTVTAAVAHDEIATSHYMSTPEHFLYHAREAQLHGSIASFLSAMILDENTLWDYNRGLSIASMSDGMADSGMSGSMSGGMSGADAMAEHLGTPPHEKLVAIYPREGVYVADNPLAILNAPWVTSTERAAAADFARYATTAEGQGVVREHGYRDIHGAASPEVAGVATLAASVHALALPDPSVLAAVQRSFPTVRKRARILFLVDVSGSMQSPIAARTTKLQAAQQAVLDALKYFDSDDEVGLAAFSNRVHQPLSPGLLTPVAPLASNRAAFVKAVQHLRPEQETPLYDAVDSFTREVAKNYDASRINAVVVLSDGQNDTDQTETRAQMLAALARLHDSSTPVLVFTLAYGHDADDATLSAIATATGGHFYDASDPLTVDTLLSDLVTSF